MMADADACRKPTGNGLKHGAYSGAAMGFAGELAKTGGQA